MKKLVFIILFVSLIIAGDKAFEFRIKAIDDFDPENNDIEDFLPDSNYVKGSGQLHYDNYFTRHFSLINDSGSRYFISYLAINEELLKGVQLMRPMGIDDIPQNFKLFERTPKATFQQSGSISRGFRIGSNQDLSVESDFNFEAYGKIGNDIEIRAVLSDRASPLQPEGKTQTLSELDKVYIEAVSPHYSARFGDIDMIIDQSRFLEVSRSVKGVIGNVNYPAAGLSAAGAIMAGQKTTQEIKPIEGNQGPYSLKSTDGSSSITVLAGTEKVWLDGQLLTRGEQNDYSIDYNTAKIQFMPRRPITSYSRITVDFEYAREDYQSSIYFGKGYIKQPGLLNAKVMGYFSADRKDSPIGFDIDSESRDYLEQIGDQPDSAYIPGWIDDSLGGYIMVDDSTDEGFHFEWVSDSLGEYDIVFTRSDSGDYVDSIDFFYYVGNSEGNYIPYRKINLPRSLNVITFQAQTDSSLDFMAKAEIASSNYDMNSYSRLGDSDNIGYAASFSIESPFIASPLGEFNIGYDFQEVAYNFESPGRIYDTDFNRDWGISGNKENIGIKMHGADLSYKPDGKTNIIISGGIREDTDGENANRMEVKLKRTRDGDNLSGNFNHAIAELMDGESELFQLDADWQKKFGLCTPLLSFEGEDRLEEGLDTIYGDRFYDLSSKFNLDFKSFDLTPEFGFREDQNRENYREPSPFSKSYNAGIEFEHKNIRAYLTHREFYAISNDAGTDLSTDMADISLNLKTRKPRITLRTSYRINGAASEKQTRVYTYVGDGNGDYSYDESRGYYIESGGEYILEYEGSGEFEPTTDLEISNRFKINSRDILPESFPGDIRLSFSTTAKQSLAERSSRGFIPQVWSFFSDSIVLYGQFKHQTDLIYDIGRIDFRVGQSYKKAANRTWTSGTELSIEDDQYLQSDFSSGNFKYSARSDLEHSRKFYPDSDRRNGDIITAKFALSTDYKGFSFIVPTILVSAFYSENKTGASATGYGGIEDAYTINGLSAEPGARVSFKKGSVMANFEYINITSSDEAGIIPYEMAGGRMAGENFEWNVDASYKLTSNSIQTFSYTGEKLPDRKAEHKMELKIQYLF